MLQAYLNGEDILEYDIDTLEDDVIFMKEVLHITKDKNMYHFCSDEVKKNTEFVKDLICNLGGDPLFITNVLDFYLFSNEDPSLEILLMARKRLEKDYAPYLCYSTIIEAKYTSMKIEATYFSEQVEQFILQKSMGFGYFLIGVMKAILL